MKKNLKIIKVKENKSYTFEQLLEMYNSCFNSGLLTLDIINEHNLQLQEILSTLQEMQIVKKSKDQIFEVGSNDDAELIQRSSNKKKRYYSFHYVGIVENNGLLIEVYPKYVNDDKLIDDDLSLALKAITKFQFKNINKTLLECAYSTNENKPASLLDTVLFIMLDYYNNGLYTNDIEIIEMDGDGPIFWDKTIDEIDPFIQDDMPIYMHTFNQRSRQNENDIFSRLHKCILTECSHILSDAGLFDFITNIDEIELSTDSLEDFGDEEYLKNLISKEKNIQFNTRRLFLLDLMFNYIDEKFNLETDDNMVVYGAKSMNLVWEDACRIALNDSYDKQIKYLNFSKKQLDKYSYKDKSLKDIRPFPLWETTKGCYNADTLEPDIICTSKNRFHIFDAKYYIVNYGSKNISQQPGIDSISKQFMYELIYKDFIKHFSLKKWIKNFFVFPSLDIESGIFGKVTFLPFDKLAPINILYLNPRDVLQRYLSNKPYTDNELKTLKILD